MIMMIVNYDTNCESNILRGLSQYKRIANAIVCYRLMPASPEVVKNKPPVGLYLSKYDQNDLIDSGNTNRLRLFATLYNNIPNCAL